jgi:hypothetical protein
MRKSAVRAVAVAMVIGAASTAGSALAAAGPAGSTSPPAEQVSAMMTNNPQQAAKPLKQLRAHLKSANDRGDVAGVQQASRGIDAALGGLQQRFNTWQLESQTVQHVNKAVQQNTELGTKLGALTDKAQRADTPQLPSLPPLPPPLDSVSSLIQGLLASLQGIVNGLLPIATPPIAVPAAPAVPIPAP